MKEMGNRWAGDGNGEEKGFYREGGSGWIWNYRRSKYIGVKQHNEEKDLAEVVTFCGTGPGCFRLVSHSLFLETPIVAGVMTEAIYSTVADV